MSSPLEELFRRALSQTERRLLVEYGSVFVTRATAPPFVIFPNEETVQRFQASLAISRRPIGDYEFELQSDAMESLVRTVREAERLGFSITGRSGDSGRRSYADTAKLWERNVDKGLHHWVGLGRMSPDEAANVLGLSLSDQVGAILKLEDERQLYFSTYFDKSILQSVAAPGASQHLSMLAFDVAEYENPAVARVLALHGWHRTVVSDLPHFTYLGYSADDLPALGLRRVENEYAGSAYSFWIPDFTSKV